MEIELGRRTIVQMHLDVNPDFSGKQRMIFFGKLDRNLLSFGVMSTVVHCSNCGAPVRPGSATCHYCHAVIAFPAGALAANTASSAAAGVPPGVLEALRNGNKIDAIRLYREATKSSLRDAKDTVDALEKKLGIG